MRSNGSVVMIEPEGQKMVCPNCQMVVADGTMRCPHCYTFLEHSTQPVPNVADTADMHDNQATREDDKPILTVEYEDWKVLWRFFIPYGIGLVLFGFLAFYVTPGKPGLLARLFQGVFVFAVVGIVYLMLDMVLTVDYSLCEGRIVKRYRLLGAVEVPMNDIVVSFVSYLWGTNLMLSYEPTIYKDKPFALRSRLGFKALKLARMGFDLNLAPKGSQEAFKEACESLGFIFEERYGGQEGHFRKASGSVDMAGNFGDALHIFTFAYRARSKEHRVNMESEDPKRGASVIDILGREG